MSAAGLAGLDVAAVLGALRRVLPASSGRPIGLHEPQFAGQEWQYLKECLDSGWVSSVGKFVDRFEGELALVTGARRAVACVNGTAALHASLQLVGVQREDEVLVPALTFVATANAVKHAGAEPHFVDSDERTLGVDPRRLGDYLGEVAALEGKGATAVCRNRRSGRRLRALVPVHVFGHPVDMDPLVELADRYRLALVEDATESLGSSYKGRATGTFGRLGVLSFNGNKIITTGGGGAILTDDEELGKLAKHLTTTAKVPHPWEFRHDRVGFNYRMPNLNAALGCAQLEQLAGLVQRKRALAGRYREALAGVPGVSFFEEPSFARSNYWLNALLLDAGLVGQRDTLLEAAQSAGIGTRPAWTPLHQLPMFASCPRMELPVAESLAARLVNLPSSAWL